MRSKHQTRACRGPWVQTLAERINDPVVRLRFLRAVAPPPEAPSCRTRTLFRTLLLTVLLAGMLASLFLMRAVARVEPVTVPLLPASPPLPRASLAPPDVWQVEQKGGAESYSNGLRIESHAAVANHPRTYVAFPAGRPGRTGGVRRSEAAGIVFHTTESLQAPFEARQNGVLKRLGESLLDYVRRRRAYHFLIDRFGRVYRVVAESDAANHAGYSVWADEKWLYVNLNESFLGVSFEAETRPGQVQAAVSPAQVRAAAMLTEMLRSRYAIPAANCVTHAHVSVNPDNMRVGYHTDWASSFPFEQLGLPDNYERALPALTEFGFEADLVFLRRTGARMRVGVERAEEGLRQRAADAGLRLPAYRKLLRERYRQRLRETRRGHAVEDEA